jgi:hypothetical protein
MELLGRDERESCAQVEPHLVAENAERADAGSVVLRDTGVEDAAEEVVICLHDNTLCPDPNASPSLASISCIAVLH